MLKLSVTSVMTRSMLPHDIYEYDSTFKWTKHRKLPNHKCTKGKKNAKVDHYFLKCLISFDLTIKSIKVWNTKCVSVDDHPRDQCMISHVISVWSATWSVHVPQRV